MFNSVCTTSDILCSTVCVQRQMTVGSLRQCYVENGIPLRFYLILLFHFHYGIFVLFSARQSLVFVKVVCISLIFCCASISHAGIVGMIGRAFRICNFRSISYLLLTSVQDWLAPKFFYMRDDSSNNHK